LVSYVRWFPHPYLLKPKVISQFTAVRRADSGNSEQYKQHLHATQPSGHNTHVVRRSYVTHQSHAAVLRLKPMKLLCFSRPANRNRERLKVNFKLQESMVAHRKGREIALPFLYPRRQIGVSGQRHVLAALSPGKRHDTHCT